MLRLFTNRMVTKIFLAMALIIGGGLILQARADARREQRELKRGTRDAADGYASLIVGSIEHAMLEGEGIKVEALVEDLKLRVRETVAGEGAHAVDTSAADIRIYDQRGIEVFKPDPITPPPPASVPDHVKKLLAMSAAPGIAGRWREVKGRLAKTIANEKRCMGCHTPMTGKPPEKNRGVLELAFDNATCVDKRDAVMTKLVKAGFYHMMAARQAKKLPDYFTETTAAAPHVRAATVYNRGAFARFGDDIPGVSEDVIKQLIADPRGTRMLATDKGNVALVPLLMEQRCRPCHKKQTDVIGKPRGVLAVALSPADKPSVCNQREMARIVETSLRFIMLSAMGRRIADYLDAAVATGAMKEIVLYDNQGRTYWTTTHPTPPSHIAKVLDQRSGSFEFLGTGMDERVRVVRPLMNKVGCKRCHDPDSKLRGVVSVSLSTAQAAEAREASMRRRTRYTAFYLLGILVILGGFLQYFVVRPVNHIGDVADEVGKGNLDVSVRYASADGDEVARLGVRINEMVRGLRTKTQLEKFVSKGTVEAASVADVSGVERAGQMRTMTVLFSDIRGFTAYSEKVSPAEVVDMLNTLLKLQADAVVAHGGDIDKFVGDELMAVFAGDDAELRAVQCAVHMRRVVQEQTHHGLAVGIGIACGDVIYGAIGHENRMDFTVIGDVVNTGARLCSAAAPHEIIVTAGVRAACADADDLTFEPGEALALKGKSEPLENFRVRGTPEA